MSPEQALGAKPAPAVDIYALGVILYELLTGRVPFQGSNPYETMDLVRFQEPVSPRQLQPNIPRDLETICLKCLEKDPKRRYESAELLADDLQCFLDHRPIHARRVSSIGKARRWCRRNPIAFVSIACVISIVLLAFTAVTRSYWRAEFNREMADERAKAERLESYRANISATANALQVYNMEGARRTLQAAPAEHRNWEWRHFQTRLEPASDVSEPADPGLGHVLFTPTGRIAVRSTRSGDHVFWNLVAHREIGRLSTRLNFVLCLRESAIAEIQSDGSIAVIDIASGRTLRTLASSGRPIHTINVSGDGKRIVTCTDDWTIRVWSVDDGRMISKFPTVTGGNRGIQLNDDGSLVAFDQRESKSVVVWDANTGKRLAELAGHDLGMFGCIFSPAGNRLVAIEPFPRNRAKLWEPVSGKFIAELDGHRNTVTGCVFSPDGKYIATCSLDQMVRIWETKTGAFIACLRGHTGVVHKIAFRGDGKRIASASADHSVRVWDVPSGDLIAVLPGHKFDVRDVVFLPDGSVASASGEGRIHTWDVRTVEGSGILRGHSSFVYGVAFHPDGERIASASWDSTVRIWNASTGETLRVLKFEEENNEKAIVTATAFHPNGKLLATRDRKSIRLWDADTGEELHRWRVSSGGWKDTRIVFSPDGRRLATGCGPFEARIWDVESRELYAVFGGHRDEIRDVAFSPDGRLLAVAADGGDSRLNVWNVERKERAHALEGHAAGLYAVTFNAAGTLAASSDVLGKVRLWSTADWKLVGELSHDAPVYGLAFTPDGTRLATACADCSLRLWDPAAARRPIAELRGDNKYYHQIAFSPDGSRLAAACGDCNVCVWDTLFARDRAKRR